MDEPLQFVGEVEIFGLETFRFFQHSHRFGKLFRIVQNDPFVQDRGVIHIIIAGRFSQLSIGKFKRFVIAFEPHIGFDDDVVEAVAVTGGKFGVFERFHADFNSLFALLGVAVTVGQAVVDFVFLPIRFSQGAQFAEHFSSSVPLAGSIGFVGDFKLFFKINGFCGKKRSGNTQQTNCQHRTEKVATNHFHIL